MSHSDCQSFIYIYIPSPYRQGSLAKWEIKDYVGGNELSLGTVKVIICSNDKVLCRVCIVCNRIVQYIEKSWELAERSQKAEKEKNKYILTSIKCYVYIEFLNKVFDLNNFRLIRKLKINKQNKNKRKIGI